MVHSVNTRNKYQLYWPHGPESIMNSKGWFKVASEGYLSTHSFSFVDEFPVFNVFSYNT
jgi:hypothetical protein